MSSTLSGFELCHALLQAKDLELSHRIFASALISLASGSVARVSVQTTDGQYHYLEISTRISTDTANESGGNDKE